MHSHRPLRFLGRTAEVPLLLGFFDTTVLNQTAVIIIIGRLQGLLHPGIGQNDGFPLGPIVLALPLAHDDGIDQIGLKIAAVDLG